MAYTITLTNGNVLTTIADTTADTSTSLTLLGKNYAGYGTILADNFVHMLENFANTSAPPNPLLGELWYDTSINVLKVCSDPITPTWVASGFPVPTGPLETSVLNQSITVTTTNADGHGFIVYDPNGPANSKYYRIRVRDDGHWVLESLNDSEVLQTTVLDTDANGYIKLAATPSSSDNTTAIATTAFVKTAINNLNSSNVVSALGYTPVQQGGGASQGNNKLYLGWDGTSLRLQVDSTDEGRLALVSQLGSAAFTSVGAIQAGVDLSGLVPKVGSSTITGSLTLTGNLTLTAGAVYSTYHRFPSDTNTGMQTGGANTGVINFTNNAGSATVQFNQFGQIWTSAYGWLQDVFVHKAGDVMTGPLSTGQINVTNVTDIADGFTYLTFTLGGGQIAMVCGNVLSHVFHPSGQINTSAYGYLENYFAQRATALEMGTARVSGNCGDTAFSSGYEVFDVGDGRHQIRVFADNCTDCSNCSNCNCSGNCGSTCFPPDALVTMADGTSKKIRDIKVGEYVMGRYGEANEVIAKEYPPLGNRSMFLVNDEHWTTDEHPHFIRDGVSAIIPEQYFVVDVGQWFDVELADGSKETWQNRGLPNAKFHKFEVGVEACFLGDYRRVTSIMEDKTWSPDFVLYNLVLGGSHTYHVDGYLVTGWPQDVDFNYETWQPTGVTYTIPKRGI